MDEVEIEKDTHKGIVSIYDITLECKDSNKYSITSKKIVVITNSIEYRKKIVKSSRL